MLSRWGNRLTGPTLAIALLSYTFGSVVRLFFNRDVGQISI